MKNEITGCTVRSRTIIKFYSGEARDHRGRYLHEIQQWPDDQLESTHDYIQWLFPLAERSGFYVHAPMLDVETIQEFRSRPELQLNMRTSLRRMLAFFGLELVDESKKLVRKGPQFRVRATNWLKYSNHNQLRITRILKSARLLGLEADAAAFYDCLSTIYAETQAEPEPDISVETLEHWKTAAGTTETKPGVNSGVTRRARTQSNHLT